MFSIKCSAILVARSWSPPRLHQLYYFLILLHLWAVMQRTHLKYYFLYKRHYYSKDEVVYRGCLRLKPSEILLLFWRNMLCRRMQAPIRDLYFYFITAHQLPLATSSQEKRSVIFENMAPASDRRRFSMFVYLKEWQTCWQLHRQEISAFSFLSRVLLYLYCLVALRTDLKSCLWTM